MRGCGKTKPWLQYLLVVRCAVILTATSRSWAGDGVDDGISPAARPVRTRIVNPAENGASWKFLIDDKSEELSPGQSKLFEHPSSIAFDRGENRGIARYSLEGGTYTFTWKTDKGWDLYQSADSSSHDATKESQAAIPNKGESKDRERAKPEEAAKAASDQDWAEKLSRVLANPKNAMLPIRSAGAEK